MHVASLRCDSQGNCTDTEDFNGSGGTSASVSFHSCSSYTVTIDGVATSYNW